MSKIETRYSIFNWRRTFTSLYFRSAGIYLGGKLAIFTLSGLASQYILTHYLTKEDYGLLVWVSTIIAFLSVFGLPGISTSITGAVAKGYEGNFHRGTWLEMAGGTIGGLVLLGFSCYYWSWLHKETESLIFIVAGVLGPGLWLDTHQSYWNGKKNFKAIFWWSVSVRLLQLLATIIVLLYYSTNPLWVFSFQTVILVAANIGAVIGIMKIGGINKKTSKEYQSYGWLFTRLKCIGVVAGQLDKFIIGAFFGLESLAVFAIGELVYSCIFIAPKAILTQITLPHLAEMEIDEAAKWIRKRMFYLMAVVILMVIAVGATISSVYPLLFSVKYSDSIYYAYLFLGCIILRSPGLLIPSLIRAHAMKKETMVGWLIISVSPIIFVPLLGWFFGIVGIILARVISQGAICGYHLLLLKHLTNK